MKILINNPALARTQRRFALLTLLIPTIGTIAAGYWAVRHGISSSSVVVFLILYMLTMLGISVGLHRLFSHRSFTPVPSVKALFAIFGMMAAQGNVIFWVANHRRHHTFSDSAQDAHSPRTHGNTLSGRLRGLWHAHIGWMLGTEVTNVFLFSKDLIRDQQIVRLNRFYPLWVALGLIVPMLIGAATVGGWHGATEGLLFGGLLRIFCTHHATWAVNSCCHAFGKRRFANDDGSRNLAWVALLTAGEGWHNNHHAFPASARLGHRWWEFDAGYGFVCLLQRCGLCTNIKALAAHADAEPLPATISQSTST